MTRGITGNSQKCEIKQQISQQQMSERRNPTSQPCFTNVWFGFNQCGTTRHLYSFNPNSTSHAWSRVRAFGTTVVMNTPQSPDFFLPPTPASGAALKACYLFDVFHSSCHHQAAHHFHEIIPFLKA